jgi:hypothetical protein
MQSAWCFPALNAKKLVRAFGGKVFDVIEATPDARGRWHRA